MLLSVRALDTHTLRADDIPLTLFYSNAAIIAVISLNYWLIRQAFSAPPSPGLGFNLYVNAFVPCVLFCRRIIRRNEMWDVWSGAMLITTQTAELQRISPIFKVGTRFCGGIKGGDFFADFQPRLETEWVCVYLHSANPRRIGKKWFESLCGAQNDKCKSSPKHCILPPLNSTSQWIN